MTRNEIRAAKVREGELLRLRNREAEQQQQQQQSPDTANTEQGKIDVETHADPTATEGPEVAKLKRADSVASMGIGKMHLATELEASIIEEVSNEEAKKLMKEDSAEEVEAAEK